MSEFNLGDRVTMTGTVVKKQTTYSEWNPYPMTTTYEESARPSTRINRAGGRVEDREFWVGVVVGKRTVVPGKTVIDTPIEYGERVFRPESGAGRVVYLVAYHLSRKPVMCFPEQLQPEDDGGSAA